MDGDLMFFLICRRAPFWGLRQTYMNEWTSGSGDRVSLSMGDPVREHGGGPLTGDSEGKIKTDILREM
jgi:hypothetical protein